MHVTFDLELRKFVVPEFIFGEGALSLAGRYVKNFGAKKVLVVTDDGIIKAGWAGKAIECLEAEGLPYSIFSNVRPNPRVEEVMEGAAVYKKEGCDVIVAVGGGSTIDCAKGVGIVSTNRKNILEFVGIDLIPVPGPPIICIPTTGVAADISQFAIITDRKVKLKTALCSKTLVPDVSLIDPYTTFTMSEDQAAYTGIDAFTHALEAYVSNASSPITELLALDAVKQISDHLIPMMREPTNIGLRGKIALGSLEAGMAFSNASLGLMHAMSHSLGGFTDCPHGECNAIFSPFVVRFNYDAVPGHYEKIGEAMGLDLKELSYDRKKEAVIDRIVGFQHDVLACCKPCNQGITKKDIPALVRNTMNSIFIITNPRPASPKDVMEIFEEALWPAAYKSR